MAQLQHGNVRWYIATDSRITHVIEKEKTNDHSRMRRSICCHWCCMCVLNAIVTFRVVAFYELAGHRTNHSEYAFLRFTNAVRKENKSVKKGRRKSVVCVIVAFLKE